MIQHLSKEKCHFLSWQTEFHCLSFNKTEHIHLLQGHQYEKKQPANNQLRVVRVKERTAFKEQHTFHFVNQKCDINMHMISHHLVVKVNIFWHKTKINLINFFCFIKKKSQDFSLVTYAGLLQSFSLFKLAFICLCFVKQHLYFEIQLMDRIKYFIH